MAATVRRSTVFNVFCAGAGLLGLVMIAYGMTIPVYTDPGAAQAIKTGACDAKGPIAGWYEPLVALETWRHPLMQAGISVLLAAVTLSGLHRVFRRTPADGICTPASRIAFFLLGYAVLATSWAAAVYSLVLDAGRGEFAWCADTIAIPAASLTVGFAIIAIVCTLIGLVLILVFGRVPVSLWHWDNDRRTKSILVSVAMGLPAAGVAGLTLVQASGSVFFDTPAGIVAVYLILAVRAAILAPRADMDARS